MNPVKRFFAFAWRVIIVQLGMIGLRADKWSAEGRNLSVLNAFLFISITISGGLIPRDLSAALSIFSVGWLLYYVGNSVILGTNLKTLWWKKSGKAQALDQYEVLLAVLFQLQGIAVFQSTQLKMTSFSPDSLEPLDYVPPAVTTSTAIMLFGVGWIVKTAATYTTGLATYYYNDMFTESSSKEGFVSSGVYYWFSSPMYGVGNLTTYGLAFYYRSTPGLIASGFCHISIFAFNYLIEQPFVKRMYLSEKHDDVHPLLDIRQDDKQEA